jgi:methionine synthase II (cobalamin-independent)
MPVKSSTKPTHKRTAPKAPPASGGRILTTHVGSLVRPAELKAFLAAQRNRKPCDEAAFDACLHDSVADVVRQQADIGLDIINDGEYGKTISWSRYILQRLSGFEQRKSQDTGMPAAVNSRSFTSTTTAARVLAA